MDRHDVDSLSSHSPLTLPSWEEQEPPTDHRSNGRSRGTNYASSIESISGDEVSSNHSTSRRKKNSFSTKFSSIDLGGSGLGGPWRGDRSDGHYHEEWTPAATTSNMAHVISLTPGQVHHASHPTPSPMSRRSAVSMQSDVQQAMPSPHTPTYMHMPVTIPISMPMASPGHRPTQVPSIDQYANYIFAEEKFFRSNSAGGVPVPRTLVDEVPVPGGARGRTMNSLRPPAGASVLPHTHSRPLALPPCFPYSSVAHSPTLSPLCHG